MQYIQYKRIKTYDPYGSIKGQFYEETGGWVFCVGGVDKPERARFVIVITITRARAY